MKQPHTRNTAGLSVCLLFASLLITGCANKGPNIIIDRQNADMSNYQADLNYCEQFGDQVQGEVGKEAAVGAAVGGATGAIWQDSSKGAAKGAGAGLVAGAVSGIRQKKRQEEHVIKNCLRTKGYKVLN